MSVATEIQRLQEAKADIKEAIENKGVTVGSSLTISDYAPLIDSIPTGTVEVESKDVDFYDYDGTRLYSYTKQEFLALNEMPANPTHDGLISQGWNWSLADAKEQVTDFNQLNIGQMYVTDDNKTRLYIHLENVRLKPYLSFCVNGSVLVEWGDGTSETVTGTSTSTILSTPHTYASGGDYVIKLSSNSTIYFNLSTSKWLLNGDGVANRYYSFALQKVELGNNICIGNFAFYRCGRLATITIPNTATGTFNCSFYECYSLKYITIQENAESISDSNFHSCSNLKYISLSKTITLLKTYAFYNCYTLSRLTLHSSITSIETYSFQNCTLIAHLILPIVSTITRGLFSGCSSMKKYDFTKYTSVPTLANTSAFGTLPKDCKIVVPDSLYDTWVVATNWSNYASYIVKESEYVG